MGGSTVSDVEEASKLLAEGILVYVKDVVNQTIKFVNDASQGSNYLKGVE